MVVVGQKWLWAVLVLVLAFSIEARMLSTYREKVPSNFEHVKNGKWVLFERVRFGGLFSGVLVPPFGSSSKTSSSPPLRPIFFSSRFKKVKRGLFGRIA